MIDVHRIPGKGERTPARATPRRRARHVLALTAIAATLSAGCGTTAPATDASAAASGSTQPASGSESAAPSDAFPVTVESCGEPVTFEQAPTRAVVNDDNMIEMMFALELTDSMAAYAAAGPRNRLPEFEDDYAAVPSLGDDYFSLEPLLGAEPDFVFSGWNYGFSEDKGITPDRLEELGIASYVLTESCRRVKEGMAPSSVAELETDIRNLGAIFGVPDRAEALIESWDDRLEAVQQKLPPESERDQTVFTYLSGTDAPGTAPGLTIVPELNSLAGGTNVFADVPKMWGKVTWEEVVERDPDVIVVVDYGGAAAEDVGENKVAYLKGLPQLQEVKAVKNDRFLILPQEAVNPGVRFVDGIEALAAVLYPDAVGV